MDLKLVGILVLLVVFQTFALPRDSSVLKSEDILKLDNGVKEDSNKVATVKTGVIPGRIWCPSEEATEEMVCQEHCLPKGYSYGICVSNTCSCI